MLEALTIGVTGHRPSRLAQVDTAALARRVGETLTTFARAAGPDRPLRLVSSLAEGADSIAFDQAIARGWTVDVVLPFDRARNAMDFPDPALLTALDDRLARAHAVLALATDENDAEVPEVSYERAGRVMLAQSDLLLAIWDGAPARGRGGTAQVIAEAVTQGIPVLHVPIADDAPIAILWDRLDEHDYGQQQLDTVPRGGIERLPQLLDHLLAGEASATLPAPDPRRRPTVAIAYAALQMLVGVRRMRRSDFWRARPADSRDAFFTDCTRGDATDGFAARVAEFVTAPYERADALATEAGRRFRSAYVSNFGLAALAVVTSLLGLVLPAAAKPVLVCVELAIIATILVVTHVGNRSGWHRLWLDGRRVAEQLRCLALSAQLGDLRLRSDPHPVTRSLARRLGLPAGTTDRAYLAGVQQSLLCLIDGQVAYLRADASRMHRLEHRLHRIGEVLFGATATICVVFLGIELGVLLAPRWQDVMEPALVWGTICSASLPAAGAAIYGIRMQGDFAGTAERNEALAERLSRIRAVSIESITSYDTLLRRVGQVADLMTQDLTSWLHTYAARPLTLPG